MPDMSRTSLTSLPRIRLIYASGITAVQNVFGAVYSGDSNAISESTTAWLLCSVRQEALFPRKVRGRQSPTVTTNLHTRKTSHYRLN